MKYLFVIYVLFAMGWCACTFPVFVFRKIKNFVERRNTRIEQNQEFYEETDF